MCKVCENCARVCEGVCENVWKYHPWVSQLKNMLLDTKNFEIGQKLANIAQNVCKVCVEWVRVCESIIYKFSCLSTCF